MVNGSMQIDDCSFFVSRCSMDEKRLYDDLKIRGFEIEVKASCKLKTGSLLVFRFSKEVYLMIW